MNNCIATMQQLDYNDRTTHKCVAHVVQTLDAQTPTSPDVLSLFLSFVVCLLALSSFYLDVCKLTLQGKSGLLSCLDI